MKKNKRVPNLAANIKQMRKNSGLSLELCALKIGLRGKSAFRAYEEGTAEPKISGLIKISELFGYGIDTILFDKIEPEKKYKYRKCIKCGGDVKKESGHPLESNYCNDCYWA